MGWTTIWSHAQRGIAHHSSSNGTVQVTMRRIAEVDTIRLVFANEYGRQKQQLRNLVIKIGETCLALPDFAVTPGSIFKTDPISIDPSAKKWQFAFQIEGSESGFAYNDADFFPESRVLDFCSGLVAIEAQTSGQCIIALGDSLTEGATWTAPLQRKLRKQKLYLVNQGINGSCLLRAGSDISTTETEELFYGYDSIRRLEGCLNSHSNVSKVILFFGANDLINGALTLETFQTGIKRLIQLCQSNNIAFQLCTLTPCLGYPGMNQDKEVLRKKINHWLKANYDSVWDFSAFVEADAHLRMRFDSGDHLHFNAAAGLAIARQISSDFIKGE